MNVTQIHCHCLHKCYYLVTCGLVFSCLVSFVFLFLSPAFRPLLPILSPHHDEMVIQSKNCQLICPPILCWTYASWKLKFYFVFAWEIVFVLYSSYPKRSNVLNPTHLQCLLFLFLMLHVSMPLTYYHTDDPP